MSHDPTGDVLLQSLQHRPFKPNIQTTSQAISQPSDQPCVEAEVLDLACIRSFNFGIFMRQPERKPAIANKESATRRSSLRNVIL
jgi:hypothetical protein